MTGQWVRALTHIVNFSALYGGTLPALTKFSVINRSVKFSAFFVGRSSKFIFGNLRDMKINQA